MPRTTLLNLPVEIHCEILKYARYSAQKAECGEVYGKHGRKRKGIIGWKWIEKERGKLSQFPYNAAAVCQLWHDILSKIPECWTRVIIDIASEPSKFLDIFRWSKDLPKLEVTVFNSHNPDPKDVDYSSLERERVSAIVDALLPHTSRCKFIAFDLVFLTSLPSPVVFLLKDAPHLDKLILECKIDNAGPPDEYSGACQLGVREPIQALSSFPLLRTLSITGFWFMFISGHPHTSEWFKKLCGQASFFRFCISHFKFQKEGQYTLQNFVKYCSAVKPSSIALSHFSLDHDGPILEGDRHDSGDEVFCLRGSVKLKNISADVIQSLFFLANISRAPTDLTFDNCAFPDVLLTLAAVTLYLKNIPCSTIPADSDSRKDSTNLASILQIWSGTFLNVVSCPSFDDTALSILPGYKESMLLTLSLNNCDNFTVRGIRDYLERRNTCSTELEKPYDDDFEHLDDLLVYGTTCPFPSEEDKEWFRTSECATPTSIRWKLRDPVDLTIQHVTYYRGRLILLRNATNHIVKFTGGGQYTLQNFVQYCSAVKPTSFALSDLSLDHDGPILEGGEHDNVVFSFRQSVNFKNVSADVIQTLFFLATISPTTLTFDNCAFPEEILSSGTSELNLKNMPYFIPADSDARKDSTI